MKIEDYKNICDNVEVSDTCREGYHAAMEQICSENKKERKQLLKWQAWRKISKAAMFWGILLVVGGGAVLSVRAYVSHRQKIQNMTNDEIVNLYEDVFQYDNKYMSRAMSEAEEQRYGELADLYCMDMVEPQGEVKVISSREEYKGTGLAFAIADGILYLPADEMTDEEILQMIEFNLLEQYVDYEAYVKATNPLDYRNRLEKMTGEEVEEIYKTYHAANTETCLMNRELSFAEMGRRKVLKELYKKGLEVPEQGILIIGNAEEYSGRDVAFCKDNGTVYFPEQEMNDEQLLEYIDFQMKAEYCENRISDEISKGVRDAWPIVEHKERERIVTLDYGLPIEEELLEQPWLIAYGEILEKYYKKNEQQYENPERYYANVCFVYLNDDEIPELLFSHGCTDMDYDDRCNTRTYLYTYKNGEAVLLSPGNQTMDDFYGYSKPFSYAERKGMVYCDYYDIYGFSTYHEETGIIDNVKDNISRMDIWNLDTMTCKFSNVNIRMLHAEYNYEREEYSDADFSYEYYRNVSSIVRDENTGEVLEIVGEKANRQTYEVAEKELWKGEAVTVLQVKDFDKIYSDDNLLESLARCYSKHK